MKENMKKILIIIVLLISVIAAYKIPRLLINKSKIELPEIKSIEEVDKNKILAIMVSNDGNNYQEYKNNTWPNKEYRFINAKCLDNKGNEIKDAVSYKEGKITLTTNKTIYCTLYFNHKETLEILRENDLNNVLSQEEVGGMYRYQGLNKQYENDSVNNPDKLQVVDNNYVCFGTSNKEECINDEDKYMYQIIGITKNGQLYLIKKQAINDNGVKYFSRNDTYTLDTGTDTDCPNGKCPEWPNTLLFKRINGISNGSKSGEGTIENEGNTDIFIDNPYYNYLKSGDNINGSNNASEWYKIIENHRWMYGDLLGGKTSNIAGEIVYGANNNDGLTLYKIETGELPTAHPVYEKGANVNSKYIWTNYVDAKIGLQYISDYLLSYSNNITDTEGSKMTWLHYGTYGIADGMGFGEATIARYGVDYSELETGDYQWMNCFWNIYPISNKLGIAAVVNWDRTIVLVRPVFYLSNTIQLSGSGLLNDPYIINL